MLLGGQERLVEAVQNHELLREDLTLGETLRHEHNLRNQVHVGHNHSAGAEERLDRLGQLRTTGVTGVHGDVGEAERVQAQGDLVFLEQEAVLLPANAVNDTLELGRHDRQHGDINAVEFVEATPGTGLSKTLEDLPHGLVVHLIRAVEHVHHVAGRASQVLDSLCLARTSRSSRRSTHDQALGLAQCDVAPVSQRSDHEATAVADVLVTVVALEIGQVDAADVSLLVDAVTELRHPLEALRGLGLDVDQLGHDVAIVHIHRHDGDDLLTVVGRQVCHDHVREHRQVLNLLLVVVLKRVLVTLLELVEGVVHLLSVHNAEGQHGDLRGPVEQELLSGLLLVRAHGL
mmetsp:Transcript_13737/g.31796  ORF Transcript_13737/g.31796 Transcript_13737/m.31796 type:complete len:346 (+) Transcript_13737:7453-8490(+)